MELTAWYFVLKLVAYSFWSGVGIAWFGRTVSSVPVAALGYGSVRLLMGFFFGGIIWIASLFVFIGVSEVLDSSSYTTEQVVTYLLVYVPIRWIEWSLLEVFINPAKSGWRGFLKGNGSVSRKWRAGGIVISCLADVPVILSIGGLALGRFMC